jgi:hypothetical protein
MDTFAVQVFPIADLDAWKSFADEISSGGRKDAHRDALRRLGVRREHAYHVAAPAGDLMVLIWEGVEQEDVGPKMGDMVANPRSEHEKHLATHVIPKIHGVDPTAGPPPAVDKVIDIQP